MTGQVRSTVVAFDLCEPVAGSDGAYDIGECGKIVSGGTGGVNNALRACLENHG